MTIALIRGYTIGINGTLHDSSKDRYTKINTGTRGEGPGDKATLVLTNKVFIPRFSCQIVLILMTVCTFLL